MGQAKVELYGHIADIQEGQTPKGKKYFKIKMACGRSDKKADGTYDNKNQAWWEITAWNDYASKLSLEGVKKGDKIKAFVQDPIPRMYQTKDGRLGCTISATLFNYNLTKVIWLPKDAKKADGYTPAGDDADLPPGAEDFDPELLGQ